MPAFDTFGDEVLDTSVGKTCPFCQVPIKPALDVQICPACGIPHHSECWEANGGCTTFGCSQAPAAIARGAATAATGAYTETLEADLVRSSAYESLRRWKRTVASVSIALFLLVTGSLICYYCFGVPFLKTANLICNQVADIDSLFLSSLLGSSGVTGNDIVEAALSARDELNGLCEELRKTWAPPRYQPFAHDLLSALEAHRDFYETLVDECASDEPDPDSVEDAADNALSKYGNVNDTALTSDLPVSMLEGSSVDIKELVASLALTKYASVEIAAYCDSFENWWQRFEDARITLSNARKRIGPSGSVPISEYSSMLCSVDTQFELRYQLDNMYVPPAFADFHEAMKRLMDAYIVYAQCIRMDAFYRCFGYGTQKTPYSGIARDLKGQLTKALNQTWENYENLKNENKCDPMDKYLNQ